MLDDEDAELAAWATAAAESVGEMMNETLRLLNFFLETESDQLAQAFLHHYPNLCLPGNLNVADMILARTRERRDAVAAVRVERRRRMLDAFANGAAETPAQRSHVHSWRDHKAQQPQALTCVEWCAACGTGFELTFQRMPSGEMAVTSTIFAAGGEIAEHVDPEVIALGLRRRAQAIQELTREGLEITAGPPVVTGPREPRGSGRAASRLTASRVAFIAASTVVVAAAIAGFAIVRGSDSSPGSAGGAGGTAPSAGAALPVGTDLATLQTPGSSDPGTSHPGTATSPADGPTAASVGPPDQAVLPPPATTSTAAAPSAPINVAVVAVNSRTLGVRWTDNSTNESSFEVNNGEASVTVGSNVASYDWSGLAPGTYMCFRVRAINGAGRSVFAPTSSPYYRCATTPVEALPAPPSFVYPVNNQTLGYDGAYMFKVTAVAGASGYLYGFFQDGVMVWENYRDEGTLSGTEYAIWSNTAAHGKFHTGDVQVWVRALVAGQWTDARIITIRLA